MSPSPVEPMMPSVWKVISRRQETEDVFTFELTPEDGNPFQFRPGQFNMIYSFGRGESAISISGDPSVSTKLVHTIRVVGQVTSGLSALNVNDLVGIRGPYGRPWPVENALGKHALVVAGGLGLAPLRPLIYELKKNIARLKTATLLYGVRAPEDILFDKEISEWMSVGINVLMSAGQASRQWKHAVGHVTTLLDRVCIHSDTVAYLCGPEVMMRFVSVELMNRGVSDKNIFISMERNMKCAVGLCGHCQFGKSFICVQGPVFSFDEMSPLLRVREL